MDITVSNVWQDLFANWPPGFRRKGAVIPAYGEQIPFMDFVIGDGAVILERPTPDAGGGRRVAVPFARIEAVKYTEPIKTEELLEAGFQGAPQTKPPAKNQPDTVRRGSNIATPTRAN